MAYPFDKGILQTPQINGNFNIIVHDGKKFISKNYHKFHYLRKNGENKFYGQ